MRRRKPRTSTFDMTVCRSAGHSAYYVSPYGDLFPRSSRFPAANVRQQRFIDIWKH